MRKTLAFLALIPLLLILQVGPATASGGGGCGAPTLEGTGTEISIEKFCFTPTVLYAPVGQEITWTNRDPVRHDVLGANGAWGGYRAMRRGATTAQTFDAPGVYPFVCTWHPGMSGAVVAGDGGLERLDIAPVRRVAGGQSGGVSPSRAGELLAVAVAGGLVFAVLAMIGGRLRRRTPDE